MFFFSQPIRSRVFVCQQSAVAGVFLLAPHAVSIVVAILFSPLVLSAASLILRVDVSMFTGLCEKSENFRLTVYKKVKPTCMVTFFSCLCVYKYIYIYVILHFNLFVCPSHISVVGHCWIGMVTKKKKQKKTPTFFISHVCALKQRLNWCLTL